MINRRPQRSLKRRVNVILDDFYGAAWPVILQHYNQVTEMNPTAQEDPRNQGTRATLTTPQGNQIYGTSGDANVHAESQAYDGAWYLAGGVSNDEIDKLNYFDYQTAGATISCEGHKASCFMCAAIAHTLLVQIEHKDPRGFTQYNVPNIFRELRDPYFKDLVGQEAYTYFQELGGALNGSTLQNQVLLSLGSELYKRHQGNSGNFKLV